LLCPRRPVESPDRERAPALPRRHPCTHGRRSRTTNYDDV